MSAVFIKERHHLKLVLEFLADTLRILSPWQGYMEKLALLYLRIHLCPSVALGNPVPPLALGHTCKPQLREPHGILFLLTYRKEAVLS